MKFSVNSIELQKVMAKVSGVIPSKSTMPILEHMLFELGGDILTVTATDMDSYLKISLKVNGIEDGRIAIPAKRILETIRSLPDSSPTFSIDVTTNKIKVATETGEFSLTGENAKEFPAPVQFKAADEIVLDSGIMKKIISRTTFAVSTDELRPAMMGVLMQSTSSELRAVATDGHRLVKYVHKPAKADSLKKDIIVPAKALALIGRSLEGGDSKISINDTHIRFAFDSTELISRLIDETYPNYESVIPSDNDKIMTVNREAALSTIRRVALYASATTHQIRFSLRSTTLTLSAQDIDFGGEAKEKIPCEYSGEDIEIGFNATYVMDILGHLDAEQVRFKFSTPTRAGLVAPANTEDGDEVIMLVMPVRLSN